jgi:(1->4)-alpha-D-glucan 1-alpha-D-glucosylmutase
VNARGPAASHLLAFDRGGAVTVATIRPVGLQRSGGWRDTALDLGGGALRDAFSGQGYSGRIAVADLLARYPIALLVPR